MKPLEGNRLTAAMCLGQVGNLVPHVVVPAVMVEHLMPLWGLSNAQAGLLAAAHPAGYMLAVPVLGALTDRIDAKKLLFWGSLLSGLFTICFGWFAQGLTSGLLWWGLAGVAFAGAYMPGLRALTDRLPSGDQSRSITFYTSSFSLGVSLSFLASQALADSLGWRMAFILTGLAPLFMVWAAWGLVSRPPAKRVQTTKLLDFRPVMRNRPAMGFILGYGAHCFELYGLRAWVVGFWTFVAMQHSGSAIFDPITVSVLVTLIAMPASLIGNEWARRYGRHRSISVIQIASAAVALTIAALTSAGPGLLLGLVLLYAFTVVADSGSLTAGMNAAAQPEFKGSTMALHSTLGFGVSALAGWAIGAARDQFGGINSPMGWSAAFVVLALGVGCGPLALWWSRRTAIPGPHV
ncbi:MAG: MFS transporter [Burkholderiaceae bacterium]